MCVVCGYVYVSRGASWIQKGVSNSRSTGSCELPHACAQNGTRVLRKVLGTLNYQAISLVSTRPFILHSPVLWDLLGLCVRLTTLYFETGTYTEWTHWLDYLASSSLGSYPTEPSPHRPFLTGHGQNKEHCCCDCKGQCFYVQIP